MKQNLTFGFVVIISLLVITASGIVAIIPAFAQQQHFTAKLSSGNEVPAITSKASGIATFELNAVGTQMKYALNVTDIDHVIAVYSCQSYWKSNWFSINSTSLIGPLKGKLN